MIDNMESEEVFGHDEINFEVQTDIITLLENIRCQTDNHCSQRQAFIALTTILNLGEEYQDYFRQAGGVEEIKQQLTDDRYELSMVAPALFCLACAIKDNVTSKMDVLSRDLLSILHQLLFSVRNQECLQSAAFFLACLVNGNVKGQHLAYETNCVEDLLTIMKEFVQNVCKDEKQWLTISRSVCACINNPQNENNQRISSCLIPHMLKVVTDWSDKKIVQHALTVLGQVMHNNASNQKRFGSCGGIDILTGLITKLVFKILVNIDGQITYWDVLISAITALDFAVAENELNATHAIRLGLVPQLLNLFQHDQMCMSDIRFPLLTLAHIMEHADLSGDPATMSQCQLLMIRFLTETESSLDDEILKLIKYILALCKKKGVCNESERQPELHGMNAILNRSKDFQMKTVNGKQQPAFNNLHRNQTAEDRMINKLHKQSFNRESKRERYDYQIMSEQSPFLENQQLQNISNSINRYYDGGKHLQSKPNQFEMSPNQMRQENSIDSQNRENYNNHLGKDVDIGQPQDIDDNDNQSDSSFQKHFVNMSLGDVNKFMTGIKDENSLIPRMLALMALQEKQIEMFSEIQKVVSTKMPGQSSEKMTPPSHEYMDKSNDLSLPFLQSYPTQLTQSSDNLRIRQIPELGSYHQHLQNISQVTNSSRFRLETINNKYGKLPPSSFSHKNDEITCEAHAKSQLNRSMQSSKSLNILSVCETNCVGAERKENEISFVNDKAKSRNNDIRQKWTDCLNHADGVDVNYHNGEHDKDQDDNMSVLSSSTIDYTKSLHSSNDRTVDKPHEKSRGDFSKDDYFVRKSQHEISKDHNKQSLNKKVLRDSNTHKEIGNCKQFSKSTEAFHANNHQNLTKTRAMAHNIRKVKSIPSIQLTTQADILEGVTFPSSSSYLLSHNHLKKQSKRKSKSPEMNEAFESAINALSISKENSRHGNQMKKYNYSNPKSPIVEFDQASKAVNNMDKAGVKDSKSCGGPKDDSDNNIIEIDDDYQEIKRSHNPYTHKSLHELKSKSECRMNVNRHISKARSFAGYELYGNEASTLRAGKKREVRKENMMSPIYSPQPIQTVKGKLAQSATLSNASSMRKKLSNSPQRKLCKKEETKQETSQVHNENKIYQKDVLRPHSKLKDIKEDKKDMYAFTSCSEMDVYPSTPESDISNRSLLRTVRKRLQHFDYNSNASYRRSRVPYSDQEVLNLRHGVATFGTRWKQIISVYQFHPSRTAVDLKEKFKRLMKPAKPKSDKSDKQCASLPFSIDEIRRLKRGVKMLGHNWKAILAGEKFLPGRTHQDLRNKWRSLSQILFNRSY